jgi:acetyl esterase/lipase
MYRAFFLALSAVSISVAADTNLERAAPVPAGEPIPTIDFFRPLVLSRPVLNPSGTHVAAVATAAEDRHSLLICDLSAPSKFEMLTGRGDMDIYQVRWLGESRVIFALSTQKQYAIGLMAADVGSLSSAYALQQYSGSELVSVPLKDRLHPLVWTRRELMTTQDQGVAVLDTDIQRGAVVDLSAAMSSHERRDQALTARDNNARHILSTFAVPPDGITYRYLTDKEGKLAYSFTAQGGNLTLHRLVDNEWHKCPIDINDDANGFDIIDTGNAPGQLIAIPHVLNGKPRPLQILDAATGQVGATILQDPAYDFTGSLYRDPATGDVLGAVFDQNGPNVNWFHEDYRKIQKLLEKSFPGLVLHILSNDVTHKIFLVSTYSDKQPSIYSWVNIATGKIGIIKNSAPWIDPRRMQPMYIVKFKTRDGRRLDAYLTLPAGATKANPPPLVVLCHGGPRVRDSWGYNGEVQFLASHGYAVLQPNYRGSPGYDWMFPVGDGWDFLKMHDDVTDATEFFMRSGLIDKDRVAIMGGSFGGYLAIEGVTDEPNLYRCAVTNAGVFDWKLQLKREKYNQFDDPSYGYVRAKLGDPDENPARYDAISPIRRADKIRVPVFVVAGKDDRIVDIEQSRHLISALDKNKVPYEKLFTGGEGHGMRYLDNQVELYDRVVVFLDKYLKPKQPVATGR